MHCRRPRVKCNDGIHVVTAPWARENSRYILLFESYAMLLVEAMLVNQARKLLRISHTSLTVMLRYRVHKAVDEMDLSDVTAICADDTSFKRGQSYVTVVSDLTTRRYIDVEEGRDIKTIEIFSSKLEAEGGDSNKVTSLRSLSLNLQYCHHIESYTIILTETNSLARISPNTEDHIYKAVIVPSIVCILPQYCIFIKY